MRSVWLIAIGVSACTSNALPPYGETMLFIDTDAPVPQMVGELRIEVINPKTHAVVDSRDVVVYGPQDWPISFSVFNGSDTFVENGFVRLRAFPKGRLDDHGDPQVGVTIDRLVQVRLVPGVLTKARVTLAGECFGTPVDMDAFTSCNGTTRVLEPPTLVMAGDPSASTLAGTFGVAPCTATPRGPATAADGTSLYQDEVCLPGGAYLFGNLTQFGRGEASGLPERAVVVSPFRMDKYEVTVGRWRYALTHGFNYDPLLSSVHHNNGPIVAGNGPSACTYSDAPMGRENFPVNCVVYAAARAFCQWAGGDLPTEAQWEYVAQVAGRPFKTVFPWGNENPTCTRAAFLRGAPPLGACIGPGVLAGPAPEDGTSDDVSVGFGVVDMGGNLMEALLDAWEPLYAPCWTSAPLHDPQCVDPTLPRSLRGGTWGNGPALVQSGTRVLSAPPPDSLFVAPQNGFRCVRDGAQ